MTTFLLTCLKIAAVVLLVVVLFHAWPVLSPFLCVGFMLLLGVGLLATLGTTVALVVAGVLALALLASMLGVVVSLAPLWIPILAIVGLVALCRGGSRGTA